MPNNVTYKTIIKTAIDQFNYIQDALNTLGAVYPSNTVRAQYPASPTTIQTARDDNLLLVTADIENIIKNQLRLAPFSTYTVSGAGTYNLAISSGWSYTTTHSQVYVPTGTVTTAYSVAPISFSSLTIGSYDSESGGYPVTSTITIENGVRNYIDSFTSGWFSSMADVTSTNLSANVTTTIPAASLVYNGSLITISRSGYIDDDLVLPTIGTTTIGVSATSASYIGTNVSGWLSAGWKSVRGASVIVDYATSSKGTATPGINNINTINTITYASITANNKVAGTDYWTLQPTVETTDAYLTPRTTVTQSGWISETITRDTSVAIGVESQTGTNLYIPRATFSVNGSQIAVTASGGGYIPNAAAVGTVSAAAINTTYLTSATNTGYEAITSVGWVGTKQYVKAGSFDSTYVGATETGPLAVSASGWISTTLNIKSGTAAVNDGSIALSAITITGDSTSSLFAVTASSSTTIGATVTSGWISTAATATFSVALSDITIKAATFSVDGSNIFVSSSGYVATGMNVGTVASAVLGFCTASQASEGGDYYDYSVYNTPVIPANGYLIINEGYYTNARISLGTLIPNAVSGENLLLNGEYSVNGTTVLGTAYIRAGYTTFDTEGNELVGTMPDLTVSNDFFTTTNTGFGLVSNNTFVTTNYYVKAGAAAVENKTINISSITIGGNLSSDVFTVTAAASTGVNLKSGANFTSGWFSTYTTATQGTVSAQLSGVTIPKATVSETITAATTFEPSITVVQTAGVSSAVNICSILGDISTDAPTSGNYIAITVPSQSSTITANVTVKTAGYLYNGTSYDQATTVDLAASTLYYSVKTPTITITSSASTIYFETDMSGYIISGSWSGTVGAAVYTKYSSYLDVTTSGWIDASSKFFSVASATIVETPYAKVSKTSDAPFTAGNVIQASGWIDALYLRSGSLTGGDFNAFTNVSVSPSDKGAAVAYNNTTSAGTHYVTVTVSKAAASLSAGYLETSATAIAAATQTVYIKANTTTSQVANTSASVSWAATATFDTATTYNSSTGAILVSGNSVEVTATANASAGAAKTFEVKDYYMLSNVSITAGTSASASTTTYTLASTATGSDVDTYVSRLYQRLLGTGCATGEEDD